MKKTRLYILVCGFILSLLQTGNVFSANNKASFSQEHEIAAAVHSAHSELELHGNQWTNVANSSFRVHGGTASLPASELRLVKAFNTQIAAASGSDNVSFKNYLSHIYPSHNFW